VGRISVFSMLASLQRLKGMGMRCDSFLFWERLQEEMSVLFAHSTEGSEKAYANPVLPT
jgi:hypothetical protein